MAVPKTYLGVLDYFGFFVEFLGCVLVGIVLQLFRDSLWTKRGIFMEKSNVCVITKKVNR